MVTSLKSSILAGVGHHFRLFNIDKKSILEYLSSPYRIILILLFTILFLPHVFVVVRDFNFIIAYEVDPGSIIDSILSLYKNSYNMNAAYHSKYYGWTYYAISYFLLMPVYLARSLNIIREDYFFFVSLRFVFFMIGLSSVLVYFEVAARALKNAFLAFISALLYVASPTVFVYFYFLHPESTGLLFLFLGVLCLLRFNEGQAEDSRWYTFGLISLVLSALSKQVFFVTALPVLFLFYYSYCYHHHLSLWKFAVSKQFGRVFLFTVFLSLLVFFIINPFALLQPQEFIANQKFMFGTQMGGTLSRTEAINTWIKKIETIPIMNVSLLLTPLTLLGAVVFGRPHKIDRIFFIVSLIGSTLYVILISISARLLLQIGYYAPVYPFFILNFMIIPLYILRNWNIPFLKVVTILSSIYFLFFVLVNDFSATLPRGYSRLMYKDTAIYQVYSYIQEKIPDGSKIAHDHLVTFPSNEGLIGCHNWQGCGTDYIEEFQPDYVIFSETWKFNGETLPATLRLKKYVKDHHFVLIDTLSYGNKDKISVWKKPDQ